MVYPAYYFQVSDQPIIQESLVDVNFQNVFELSRQFDLEKYFNSKEDHINSFHFPFSETLSYEYSNKEFLSGNDLTYGFSSPIREANSQFENNYSKTILYKLSGDYIKACCLLEHYLQEFGEINFANGEEIISTDDRAGCFYNHVLRFNNYRYTAEIGLFNLYLKSTLTKRKFEVALNTNFSKDNVQFLLGLPPIIFYEVNNEKPNSVRFFTFVDFILRFFSDEEEGTDQVTLYFGDCYEAIFRD